MNDENTEGGANEDETMSIGNSNLECTDDDDHDDGDLQVLAVR